MKVGDIIRKKVQSGALVGPYMRIEVIEEDIVYASVFGSDAPNLIIFKSNVHVCTFKELTISTKMLEELRTGFKCEVTHGCTPTWKAVVNDKPEIIIFNTGYVKSKDGYITCKSPFVLEESRIISGKVKLFVKKLEYV